jgi:hypothetical protein
MLVFLVGKIQRVAHSAITFAAAHRSTPAR